MVRYKKNFLLNGSMQDNYFQTNSREIKNSLWFVIYFDENLPKKVDKNIIILKKAKRFNYNFFNFLQVIFKIFIENKMHIKKILHYIVRLRLLYLLFLYSHIHILLDQMYNF